MKRLFIILCGISILLGGIIFIIYKREYSKNEEVVDIFKKDNSSDDEVEVEKKNISKKVFVDIKGMVNNPGVYEVDNNKRVNDVIDIAGGLKEGADTSNINLAKLVEDEMTIIIYSTEEVLEKFKSEVCICNCPYIDNNACINNVSNELININTCTIDDLMSITGIGKSKAEAIIEYRESKGLFTTIDDIKNVSGIGDSLFEKIKEYITV